VRRTRARGGSDRAGARLDVEIDPETGELASVRIGGRELLVAPPELCLWRAPTDNDGLKLAPLQDFKPLGRWRAWGLDRLAREVLGVTTRGRVTTVRAAYGAVTRRTVYTAHDDGSLGIDDDVRIPKEITDLPRVGTVLRLTPAFHRLTWLGRGPHESYPDRRRGARIGRWESSVAEQYVPYVMPQEHGLHVDTEWFELTDAEGTGLRVEAATRFAFSASHFSADDLTAATHADELVARPEVIVHVDAAHRGLGTLSCGPDTLPEYRLGPGRYRWSQVWRAVTP
jgi:beta-galactosidase